MKKALLFLLVLLISIIIFKNSNSQDAYKFRAKYVSFMQKNSYSNWGNWSDWEQTNVLIVINLEDERVTIFAKETHYLDIYKSDTDESGGKSTLYFWAVDEDGINCRIRFIYYEDEDYRQLYIDYSDLIVAYSIKPMFQN